MAMKARYEVIDGEVIAEKRSGVRRCYVPSPLGSTVALLDNIQTQTDTFTYWPYGEEQSRTGTTPAPFRFVGSRGYYRDAAGRVYIRARELSTRYARWLTPDPIRSHGANHFEYVLNDPVNLTDPSGLKAARPCPPTRGWLIHGCYCGPNQAYPEPRPDPVDSVDGCCRDHDDCWAGNHCSIPKDVYDPYCQACDVILCTCVATKPCDNPKTLPTCSLAKAIIPCTFPACRPMCGGLDGVDTSLGAISVG